MFYQIRKPKILDNFLNIYCLPKLSEDQISNLNKPLTSRELEAVIKIFTNPNSEARWFVPRILQNFQRGVKANIPQIILHNYKGGLLPNSFYKTTDNLRPKQ